MSEVLRYCDETKTAFSKEEYLKRFLILIRIKPLSKEELIKRWEALPIVTIEDDSKLTFEDICDNLMNKAEESRDFKKAIIRVCGQILHEENQTIIADDLLELSADFDELF